MNRLVYPGAPESLTGIEDTSSVLVGSNEAQKAYKQASKASSAHAASGQQSGDQESAKPAINLSAKAQILLALGIVVAVFVAVFTYDAIKNNNHDSHQAATPSSAESYPSSAGDDTAGRPNDPHRPDQKPAEGGESSGKLGKVEAQVKDKTYADTIDSSIVPESVKPFTDICGASKTIATRMKPGRAGGVSQGHGLSCMPKADYRDDFRAIQFADNPNVINTTKNGYSPVEEEKLPLKSTRGSTFRVTKAGTDSLVVEEILKGDKGVVTYFTNTQDSKAVVAAFKKLKVAQ